MSEKVITLGNLKYYNDVIQSQLNNRVTIEDGKGLSSNDFTDELKEKINLFNPDIYATEEFVSNEISKIDIPEPDLTGYVSKKELAELNFYDIQNNPILNTEDGKLLFTDENGNIGLQLEADNTLYVKDVVAGENILSNKADISYVDDKVSSIDIPSLDGYATESYVITKVAEAKLEGSDITIPVQDVKVNGSTVIKDMVANIDLTPYAKTSDIPSLDGYAKTSDIPSISGLASEKYVDDKFESIEIPTVDFTGLATEQWVEDKKYLTRHQDITHLATKEELANKDFYEIHNNPILNTEDGKLLFVDESGNIGLQLEADNTLYVKDVVAGENILSNKADISYVDDKLSSVEIPSLDEYAKVSDIPSLDGYAKTSDIPSLDGYAKTSDIPSLDGYAKTSDIPSLDGYAKTSDIPKVDLTGLATEQWVEDKNYLTKHQNITHLATKEELANKDFYEIHNNPILNTEDGKLLFVDESGNIGLQLEADNTLYVKDIYCSDVSFSYLLNYISQLENRILQLEQTLNK
jgi:hypothetical protein